MRSKFLVVAALVSGAVSTAHAQLSVTPFIGEVIPLNNMITDTSGGSGSYYRLTSPTLYGLRLSKQMSPRLVLQLQARAGKGGFEAVPGAAPNRLSPALQVPGPPRRARDPRSDVVN